MTNINFKAQYIAPTTIAKRDANNQIKEITASFVEFDPTEETDVRAICKTASLWEFGDEYCHSIARNIKKTHSLYNFELEEPRTRFFGLTLQKKNLDTPNSEEILGVVEIDKESNTTQRISFLQVDPDNNMNAFKPLFLGIGTAIVHCVQKLFKDNKIILQPAKCSSVINFYKKNGFEILNNTSDMIWNGAKSGKVLSRII